MLPRMFHDALRSFVRPGTSRIPGLRFFRPGPCLVAALLSVSSSAVAQDTAAAKPEDTKPDLSVEMRRISVSDEEKKRLEKGDVLIDVKRVEGSGIPVATVRAVIDAAPQKVWKLIDRCEAYVGVMPRISQASELERQGTRVRCAIRFSPPWPLSDMNSITVARHLVGPPAWSRTWELESGDYKENSGHWLLHEYAGDPNRSLVEYRLKSEPNVSVPRFLQDMGVKSALPDMIAQIRKAVAK